MSRGAGGDGPRSTVAARLRLQAAASAVRKRFARANVPTSLKQSVQVRLQEIDGPDEVVIEGEP